MRLLEIGRQASFAGTPESRFSKTAPPGNDEIQENEAIRPAVRCSTHKTTTWILLTRLSNSTRVTQTHSNTYTHKRTHAHTHTLSPSTPTSAPPKHARHDRHTSQNSLHHRMTTQTPRHHTSSHLFEEEPGVAGSAQEGRPLQTVLEDVLQRWTQSASETRGTNVFRPHSW